MGLVQPEGAWEAAAGVRSPAGERADHEARLGEPLHLPAAQLTSAVSVGTRERSAGPQPAWASRRKPPCSELSSCVPFLLFRAKPLGHLNSLSKPR